MKRIILYLLLDFSESLTVRGGKVRFTLSAYSIVLLEY